MDMWKEQMRQRHGHDIQSRLNLIGATRWWSKHECLQKIFGTFEDGSSGMFCDVIKVLYYVSTSKKLTVKVRFDASAILDKYDSISTYFGSHYLSTHHGDNLCTFKVLADLWTGFHQCF